MKAFFFKPTNAFIGKFDVADIGGIHEAFTAFARDNEVSPYDYLECDGRTWTVMEADAELHLVEGRKYHPDSKDPAQTPVSAVPRPTLPSRYRDSYRTATVLDCMGLGIKLLGAVAGLIQMFMGIAASTEVHPLGFPVGLVGGMLVAATFFVLGVIIRALGRILTATLDSAVHSSPFLDDDEKRDLIMNR